jgi:hypothetical protein
MLHTNITFIYLSIVLLRSEGTIALYNIMHVTHRYIKYVCFTQDTHVLIYVVACVARFHV